MISGWVRSGAALPFAMRYQGSDGQVRGIVAVMLDVVWWKTDRSFAKAAGKRFAHGRGPHRHHPARRPIQATPPGRSAVGRTLENFTTLTRRPILRNPGHRSIFGIAPGPVHRHRDRSARHPGRSGRGDPAARVLPDRRVGGGAAGGRLPGHRFIQRPVSALVEAAELGDGDYRARVGLPDDRVGFGVRRAPSTLWPKPWNGGRGCDVAGHGP